MLDLFQLLIRRQFETLSFGSLFASDGQNRHDVFGYRIQFDGRNSFRDGKPHPADQMLATVQLLEDKYEIPGWLMSSGSLRVLPLIATLLDPEPPPVVFIEEVENGLDPRTVGLVVDLMRSAASSGRSQVIATTHSPYLLDMLDLDDVLLCERGPKGPAFSWPASRKEMKAWRDRFMPGKLYTMSALQHEPQAPIADNKPQEGEAPARGWGEDK